jgi:hypothetical protein
MQSVGIAIDRIDTSRLLLGLHGAVSPVRLPHCLDLFWRLDFLGGSTFGETMPAPTLAELTDLSNASCASSRLTGYLATPEGHAPGPVS